MRAGIVVNVTRADRLRLEAIIADRSTPQKHVWRANVVLATADGYGTAEIMRRSKDQEYVDPPAHAVLLSVDEKSQIPALDRPQPGLPMKKGRAGTMTHDYKRHGTTT